MKHYRAPEISNDEFHAWIAASDRHDAIAASADEEGGPSLSLVTTTDRESPSPTDPLPPAPYHDHTDAPDEGANPATADRLTGRGSPLSPSIMRSMAAPNGSGIGAN